MGGSSALILITNPLPPPAPPRFFSSVSIGNDWFSRSQKLYALQEAAIGLFHPQREGDGCGES